MSLTLVTGLWDIKRSTLSADWNRSYESYLDRLSKLLDVEENLIIFGDKNLEKFVFSKRRSENTQFILRDLSWFENNFFDRIQNFIFI